MSVRNITPQVMTYRLKGEGYSPEETPSKNTRDMDKDKLNMNLQAMV